MAHTLVSPFLKPYFKRNTRVRVLICDPANNILLIRSWFSHQQWSLPGGGINWGEDLLDAAVREVQEETGIVVQKNSLYSLGEFKNTNPNEPFTIKCLGVRIAHQAAHTPALRRLEILEVQWFPMGRLPQNCSPTVKLAIERAGS